MDEQITKADTPQYYVIQVRTGVENKFIKIADRILPRGESRLVWPRRSLEIRRGGVWINSVASLYPGYLFWQTDELNDNDLRQLQGIQGFIRFLKRDDIIVPIEKRERYILMDMISSGEILGKSKVVFDENSKIRVIQGPLKLLEGNIIKVDRRKGRAKVNLSLHGSNFIVDMGFEVMEPVSDIYGSCIGLNKIA